MFGGLEDNSYICIGIIIDSNDKMKIHFLKSVDIAIVAMAVMMLSCGHGQQAVSNQSVADSLLRAAADAEDYERIIALADSLEPTGDISLIKSAYYRGASYAMLNDFKQAKETLEPVMDMIPKNAEDSTFHLKSMIYMAEVLSSERDYEGVLRIALPQIEKLKDTEGGKSLQMGYLISYVGHAQMWLGRKEDAAKSYEQSFNTLLENSHANPSYQSINNVFILAYNTYNEYQAVDDYVGAEKWYHRQDSILAILSERDDVPAPVMDELVASKNISKQEGHDGSRRIAHG